MITIERLEQLILKGNSVLSTHRPNPPGIVGFPTLDSGQFTAWRTQVLSYLYSSFPKDNQYILSFEDNVSKGYKASVESGIGILKSIIEDINLGLINQTIDTTFSPIDPITNIFDRFHIVVRQLRNRYNSRPTLDVTDEFDSQDLLRSLLSVHFDDIRLEEWTPSYAGKSSRMDILLKDFKIVIELKKTRSGLGEKLIGDQLIEDIARYQTHPDCETLLCFVYDPEGLIGNPKGMESDLSKENEKLKVRTFIRP